MDFSFADEQADLRGLAREFFADVAATRSVGDFDRALWTRLATELGFTGIGVPASAGGGDAGLVEVAIVVEEAGRVLLPVPFLPTVAAAAALRTLDHPAAIEVLEAIVNGAVVALGAGTPTGPLPLVIDGDVADHVLVAAPDGLHLLHDPVVTGEPTIDLTRPVATVQAAHSTVLGSATGAIPALRSLLAVESLGVAAASLERTIAYLRERHQFGVPLATFQALRHRVADLAVAVEAATSSAWYAVRTESTVDAIIAQLVATRAAYAVTAESIHLHGGIGFTWEHHAHRYFKRATLNQTVLGDPAALRRLLAPHALAGLTPPQQVSAGPAPH